MHRTPITIGITIYAVLTFVVLDWISILTVFTETYPSVPVIPKNTPFSSKDSSSASFARRLIFSCFVNFLP